MMTFNLENQPKITASQRKSCLPHTGRTWQC